MGEGRRLLTSMLGVYASTCKVFDWAVSNEVVTFHLGCETELPGR